MAKHTITKSLAIYEKLLRNAWKTTWRHKELWLFGLFGGIAYSGTILQNVFENLFRVRPADQLTTEALEQSSVSIPYIISYGRVIATLPAARLIITITAMLVLAAVIVYVVIMAQHILLSSIHRAASRKKHLTAREIFANRKHVHFWRLFAIDALAIISTNIIVIAASFPLILLLSDQIVLNFFVYIALYLIVLPLLFGINMMAMFSLIHVVRREDGILEAIKRAFSVIHKHWLFVSEITLILFLINLIAAIVFFGIMSLVAVIVLPIFFAGVASGSLFLMLLSGFIAAITIILLYLVYFGGITTFNYTLWTEVVERLERFGGLPALEGLLVKFKK